MPAQKLVQKAPPRLIRMFKPYVVIVKIILIVAVLAVYTWFVYTSGQDDIRAAMADEVAQATAAARKEEQVKQGKINELSQKTYNELASVNSQLNDDIERLHKRTDKRHLPNSSKTECKGATGADLSRTDAKFLTREAARADRLRIALKTCYEYADTVSD